MATKKELEAQLDLQKEINTLLAQRVGIEKDIVSEIQENTNLLNDQLSAITYQGVEKTLLKQLQRDINKIATTNFLQLKSELGTLKTKNRITQEGLILTEKINHLEGLKGEIHEGSLEHQEAINESIQAQIESATKLKSEIFELGKESDKIKSTWGVSMFSSLSSITKYSPGLSGPFEAAAEAARRAQTNISLAGKEAGNLIGPKMAGLKSLFGTFSKAFGPIPMALLLIKKIWDAMMGISTQTAEFSNNLLIGADAADNLRHSVYDQSELYNVIAATQGRITTTNADYLKGLSGINEELGLQLNLVEDFGEQTAQNVAEAGMMVEQFGFSAKATTQLFKEATKLNIPLEQYTKELFGGVGLLSAQSGLTVDIKKNVEEAVQISGNLKANYRGSTKELANAVFQAKLLGLNLQQTEGIASSLLDFESSIQSEMEAELLTGRQLNLEKAREAALMGDTKSLMEEISRQGIDQRDFLKMNIIQRQAIAKALGMEVNEMADMFQKQSEFDALQERNLEAVNKLKDAGLELDYENLNLKEASLQKIQRAAKKAGVNEAELRDILGEQIYLRKQEESASRKFSKALEQVKEYFVNFVEDGALDLLAEGIQSLADSWIFQGAREKAELKNAAEQAQAQYEAGNIDLTERDIIIEAPKAGGDEMGWFHSSLADQARKIEKDKFKPLKDKTSVAVKDFVIKPMNEDTIVTAGGTSLGRTDEMVTELKKNNELLGKLLTSKGDVTLDGQKVGEALVLGAYKLQ